MSKEKEQGKEITIKQCAYCGKTFDTGFVEDWAYKLKQGKGLIIYFCRYTHKTAYQREHKKRSYRTFAADAKRASGEGKR